MYCRDVYTIATKYFLKLISGIDKNITEAAANAVNAASNAVVPPSNAVVASNVPAPVLQPAATNRSRVMVSSLGLPYNALVCMIIYHYTIVYIYICHYTIVYIYMS